MSKITLNNVTLDELEKVKFYCDTRSDQLDIYYRLAEPLGLNRVVYQCCSNTEPYFIISPNANQDPFQYSVLPDRGIFNNVFSLRAFSVPSSYVNERILNLLDSQFLPFDFPNRSELINIESLRDVKNYFDEYHNYYLEAIRLDLLDTYSLILDRIRDTYPEAVSICSSAIEVVPSKARGDEIDLTHYQSNFQLDVFYRGSFLSIFMFKTLESNRAFIGMMNRLDNLSESEQDNFIFTAEDCLKEIFNERYSL